MFPLGSPFFPRKMAHLPQSRMAVSLLNHTLGSQHRSWPWAPWDEMHNSQREEDIPPEAQGRLATPFQNDYCRSQEGQHGEQPRQGTLSP